MVLRQGRKSGQSTALGKVWQGGIADQGAAEAAVACAGTLGLRMGLCTDMPCMSVCTGVGARVVVRQMPVVNSGFVRVVVCINYGLGARCSVVRRVVTGCGLGGRCQ